jgi:hypothetical protein
LQILAADARIEDEGGVHPILVLDQRNIEDARQELRCGKRLF